jgi:hypothetical protein
MLSTPMLLFFGAGLTDTMFDTCARSLGKLVVNKTASNLTLAGVGHYDTIQVINGSIAMGAPGDTQYCRGLSITTTSTCVLTAPIVVTDSIYILAGATVTYSGVGKIICSTCKQAQGGNAARIYYPTIGPIDYPGPNVFTDTVGKAKTYAVTFSGCTLGKDSVVLVGSWPAGYTINASTGLISYSGIGSPVTAGTYSVRAYYNAGTYSGVDVTVGVVQLSSRRRHGGALNCGLLISTGD